jgi:dTDP-4-dehydrorhamnose reductase
LITGAKGLVGTALAEHCSANGDAVISYDHKELDITDFAAVESVMINERPEAVINCAAWTDVDGCESQAGKAWQANAFGPQNLALAALKTNAAFITISTDYVFDGDKDGFYTQRDQPRPISVYGSSKLDGERRALATNARTIVVRSGYIFGAAGKNFLSTVVSRAQRGEKLTAISDYWGTPTYGHDLAVRLRELAALDLPGIYHVVNSGEGASFETFTREALKLAGLNSDTIGVVSGADLNRPAPRPRNSRLKCLLSEAIGLSPLPHWHDALARFVSTDYPDS